MTYRKIITAVADKGSGCTLIGESAVKRIGREVNRRRSCLRLRALADTPVRILKVMVRIQSGRNEG